MSDAEDTPVKGSKRPRVAGPLAPIAQPMAGKKLHKRLYKVVKKGEDAAVRREKTKTKEGEAKNPPK